MISIEKIGFYLPETRIDNMDNLKKFELDEDFLLEKIGVKELRIKRHDEETSDMCVKAYNDLQQKSGCKNDEIDCLVVCTQNPDGNGLPHTSAIVHGKLNLKEECAVFDISLGCSGYVYSLSLMKSFMEANLLKMGVLITADPYSKIMNYDDKHTSLLFGDAATATLLTHQTKNVWNIRHFLFGSDGSKSQLIRVDESKQLIMKGSDVFKFVAKKIPEHILKVIEKNGLSLEQIDLFILHQGSKYIVDTVRDKLNLPESKVMFLAALYGNTGSSSIPMILKDLPFDRRYVLISGFGVGLSWASCVLECSN